MRITRTDLSLISRIYDVVLDPDSWDDVLDRFVEQCGAAAGQLTLADRSIPEIRLGRVSARYRDPEVLREYHQRYAEYERPAFECMSDKPAGRWVPDEEGFGRHPENILSSVWLRDRCGVFRRSATRLNDTDAWFDIVTLAYSADRGNMTDPERARASIFVPHLAKAIEATRPFVALRARFQAVLDALDRFHLGVFILTATGNVVVHNREADRIASLDDGLAIDAFHRLSARDPDARAAFSEAVRRAAATAAADDDATGTLLSVARRSGGDAFLLGVSPIGSVSGGFSGSLKGALVLAIDPENRAVVSTAGMEALYGLTGAEADVLRLMVQGHATGEMAELRGTSPETVRAQVKALLAKTRARGRQDLVRLALTVNLPIDPADGP